MSLNLAYYITGHGLGHATRSVEIIYHLILTGRYRISIISPIEKSFFLEAISKQFDLQEEHSHTYSSSIHSDLEFFERTLDSGAIQSDALTVDPYGSLHKYYHNVHRNYVELVDKEVLWLRESRIDIVLVDATPIAVRAGSLMGAKVIVLSNFSWDFIYQEMLHYLEGMDDDLFHEYQSMIRTCEEDYSHCSLFIQYPGICPLSSLISPEKIKVGPLVARISKKTKSEMRLEYKVDESTKILLLGFGGHSFNFQLKDSFLPEGWICFILGGSKTEIYPSSSNRFIFVGFDCSVPDLISMSDVVLGKVGYGFVSECLAAKVPLIYVPRSNWPEEKYLIYLLTETYSAGLEMSLEHFIAGDWANHLIRALSFRWELMEDHNPISAAKRVVDLIEMV
jgi:L-arabinokinase